MIANALDSIKLYLVSRLSLICLWFENSLPLSKVMFMTLSDTGDRRVTIELVTSELSQGKLI